jgi:DNA-binding Lrp family transcriptional regulator
MTSRVRDFRRGGWFWIDNEVIDTLAADMKPFALAVYVYLCRRANDAQEAWPSQRTIAEDLGINRGTVRSAVKQLSDMGMIRVEVERKEDGSFDSATYILLPLDKEEGGLLAQGGPIGPKEDTVKKNMSTNTLVDSGKPQTPKNKSLEKYVTDRIFEAMREAGYRIPHEDYGYHVGRAKDMVGKDSPTDQEIEDLPDAFVEHFDIFGKTDAPKALIHLRRKPRREERVNGHQESSEPLLSAEELERIQEMRKRSLEVLAQADQSEAT